MLKTSSGEIIVSEMERQWLPVKRWQSLHPYFGAVNFVYEQVRKNVLLHIKVGGKVLIASDALEVLAEQQNGGGDEE